MHIGCIARPFTHSAGGSESALLARRPVPTRAGKFRTPPAIPSATPTIFAKKHFFFPTSTINLLRRVWQHSRIRPVSTCRNLTAFSWLKPRTHFQTPNRLLTGRRILHDDGHCRHSSDGRRIWLVKQNPEIRGKYSIFFVSYRVTITKKLSIKVNCKVIFIYLP